MKITVAKARKSVNNLARIMPNLSAAKPGKRRILASVVHFQLLYGADVWSENMNRSDWNELYMIQRRMALRVVSAYRMCLKRQF